MIDYLGAKISAMGSYLVGTGLIVGDVVGWLDDHAGFYGCVVTTATLIMNFHFNRKRKNQ
ncbi:hypothetical protein [Aliamphritea hakodatensis]|uniref:hypothetical protein n=1 Tax=Aliamphritea hakodatensis TaxID=2895352 RepID=UPI0022FD3D28|nr:hypothetical protein [Aliamphritea hakodatensis]